MREIFSNNAVGYLTQNLSSTDTIIYINPTDVFPNPELGVEYFKLTLLGTCSQELEIVTIIENCGSCLKIGQRGADGTEPGTFTVGDIAYNALTAGSVQEMIDSYRWYLGAQCPAPTGNIEEGSYYFDTCQDRFLFWNGVEWVATYQLAPTVAGQFTWVYTESQNAGLILPRSDIYSNELPIITSRGHLPEVFLNGVRLTEQINPDILVGDYDVQYETSNIKILDAFTASPTEIAVIVVMIHLAASESIELGGAYSNAYSTAYNI